MPSLEPGARPRGRWSQRWCGTRMTAPCSPPLTRTGSGSPLIRRSSRRTAPKRTSSRVSTRRCRTTEQVVHQGDVVWADPEPTRGSEQAKARPFVVVSVDQLNSSGLGLSLAVPLTRTDFSNALHLEIGPPEGGLKDKSFAMPEQLRPLSHESVSRRLGALRGATLSELLRRCRLLLSEPR
jgi:mRNA interferase MazF